MSDVFGEWCFVLAPAACLLTLLLAHPLHEIVFARQSAVSRTAIGVQGRVAVIDVVLKQRVVCHVGVVTVHDQVDLEVLKQAEIKKQHAHTKLQGNLSWLL